MIISDNCSSISGKVCIAIGSTPAIGALVLLFIKGNRPFENLSAIRIVSGITLGSIGTLALGTGIFFVAISSIRRKCASKNESIDTLLISKNATEQLSREISWEVKQISAVRSIDGYLLTFDNYFKLILSERTQGFSFQLVRVDYKDHMLMLHRYNPFIGSMSTVLSDMKEFLVCFPNSFSNKEADHLLKNINASTADHSKSPSIFPSHHITIDHEPFVTPYEKKAVREWKISGIRLTS